MGFSANIDDVPDTNSPQEGVFMDVCINVPDEAFQKIQARWSDLSRSALEALAIEAYRAEILTEAEVQRMLGLASRWDTDRFLKGVQAYLDYNDTDLDQDMAAIRDFRTQ
jgi:hypothetical protein